MQTVLRTFLVLVLLGVATGCRAPAPSATAAEVNTRGAIASAHPLATAVGLAILERGGNAFDAAVAVAAALAVVEPYSSGLGGGGFFLLHRQSDGRSVMIDARERAPLAAKPEHYLRPDGSPVPGASTRGGTAVGIPGLPAGLAHLAGQYGRLPLAVSLVPAIHLAREGFHADERYVRIAGLREKFLREGVNTDVFLDGGRVPRQGYLLRQPDLARTLERIAGTGAAAFYEGDLARAMISTVRGAGGFWTAEDLRSYRIVEREPVRFRYRGAQITAAALPSAGGVALAQTLGMLERFDIGRPGVPRTDHLVVEALRRAFRDRSRYLGDPDHTDVPMGQLLSARYIAEQGADIDRERSSRSDAAPAPARAESGNTTHFSIVDREGNRVAATLTINLLFGSGIVAEGTGVLLNNEMDDFSLRPDVPNAFQLRGGAANAVAGGKRPLSSMTPVFVEDEKGVLVVGAPGGSRIVSQVLLAILEYLGADEVDLDRLVAMRRFHHQHWPDRLEIEPEGFDSRWTGEMAARGHTLHTATRAWGNMQAVFDPRAGPPRAASDPRGRGIGWY